MTWTERIALLAAGSLIGWVLITRLTARRADHRLENVAIGVQWQWGVAHGRRGRLEGHPCPAFFKTDDPVRNAWLRGIVAGWEEADRDLAQAGSWVEGIEDVVEGWRDAAA